MNKIISEHIHINQLGYCRYAVKTVWVSEEASRFSVQNAESGKSVFSGMLKPVEKDDISCCATLAGDFSAVTESGDYYIAIEELGASYSFKISDDVYTPVTVAIQKMLYFQRCGIGLEELYAGLYAHAACHLDSAIDYDDHSRIIQAQGGWHDAGDYGRYAVPAARTIADLLWTYQLFSDVCSDETGIPESGNGVPDILDEACVGLEWLMKMQAESGGVYHKLTPLDFCGMIMPEAEDQMHYAIRISPTATGAFAAVMAMATRLYKNIDAEFAGKMQTAAKRAFEFIRTHPDYPLFKNPNDVITGEYPDASAEDEIYWAAVELYLLTDENQYRNEAKRRYSCHAKLNPYDKLEWYDVGYLGTFSYLYSKKDQDSAFVSRLKADTLAACEELIRLAEKKSFHLAMEAKDFVWGSNMIVANRANILIMADAVFGAPESEELIQSHLDYILGCNILNQCYITGFGSKTVHFPHHRLSAADGVDEPVPGMVAGGPNHDMQDEVAKRLFDTNTPPVACYSDDEAAFSLNEAATYWNAAVLLMINYFNKR